MGSKAITAFSQNSPVKDRTTIIIDAGHGGVDGGATSCTGVLESNINLEIALRLSDLMHLIGLPTKMIRSTDRSAYTSGNTIAAKKVSDLKERVKIINETPNAYLISIHQNYFTDGRYNGAQVFYPKTEGSEELAKQLQDQFRSVLNPGSHRQAKRSSGVYLMEHIQCPGILVECGFLSNSNEEYLLRDNTYQRKLCAVIASTVSNYLFST
jgi:N-acetylmuramoyl-L-alanine amidase